MGENPNIILNIANRIGNHVQSIIYVEWQKTKVVHYGIWRPSTYPTPKHQENV